MWTSVYLALLVIIVFVYFMYRVREKFHNIPPGPPGFPLVGNLEVLNFTGMDSLRRAWKHYGDIYSFRLGTQLTVCVAGRETLKEMFIKRGDLSWDRASSFITAAGDGKGISGSTGHLWLEHRAFANKTFRTLGFGRNSLEEQIQEEVSIFLSEMEKTSGGVFDINGLLTTSISNIVSRLSFGKRFDHHDEKAQCLQRLIAKAYSNPKIYLLNYLPFLRFLPGDICGIKAFNENVRQVCSYLRGEVEEHKCSLDVNHLRDYIDEYLVYRKQQPNKQDSTFTDEQLVVSIRNFFIAGTETTVGSIRWGVLFLIRDPKVQAKMRKEIHSVIGPSETPTMQHRSSLPYCQAVIAETQRLGNAAPTSLPHIASEEFICNGYRIPKGTTLIADLEALAFDPVVFPNPEIFDPERFISKTGEFFGQERIMPFSIGKRICLGEPLARMELFLFLVSIVQRFELKPENENLLPKVEGRIGVGHYPNPFNMKAISL